MAPLALPHCLWLSYWHPERPNPNVQSPNPKHPDLKSPKPWITYWSNIFLVTEGGTANQEFGCTVRWIYHSPPLNVRMIWWQPNLRTALKRKSWSSRPGRLFLGIQPWSLLACNIVLIDLYLQIMVYSRHRNHRIKTKQFWIECETPSFLRIFISKFE